MCDDVKDVLDLFQFAHKDKRGTDDAVNTLVHLVLKHLEQPKAYTRLLFVDFSSAFDDDDCFYIALFSALEQTHCARM